MQAMGPRSWGVLERLTADPSSVMTVRQLARELGVSERTVRYDISTLAEWLQRHGVKLERVPRKGVYIASSDMNRAMKLVSERGATSGEPDTYLTAQQRISTIIAELLGDVRLRTVEEIADTFSVSKTTATRDMRSVDKWFLDHGIKATWNVRDGWRLDASEYIRRRAIVSFVEDALGITSGMLTGTLADSMFDGLRDSLHISEQNLEGAATALGSVLDSQEIFLTDAAFTDISCYICVAVSRMEANHFVMELPKGIESLGRPTLAPLVLSLFKRLGCSGQDSLLSREAQVVSALIAASPCMRIDSSGMDHADTAERVADRLLIYISEEIGYDLYLDRELVDGLKIHIQSLLARERLGLTARNEMLSEIRGRFPDLFEMCRRALLIAQEQYGLEAGEEEIGFIVMYVGAALERLQHGPLLNRSVRVALVCGAGVGTVAFLSRSIVKEFPHFSIAARLSIRDCLSYDYKDIDVILCTVDLPYILPRPVIRVSSMLTRTDVRRIESFLRMHPHPQPDFLIKEIVSLVGLTCDIRDLAKLEEGLVSLLAKGGGNDAEEAALPKLLSLEELVKERFIQVHVSVKSYEEAVEAAASPLLQMGWMTKEYYLQILDYANRFEQYGIILSPLCAPHAEPDDRNRPAISIATLAHEIYVPVGGEKIGLSVLIVLCLKTPVAHSAALDELFCLVDECPDFIRDLQRSQSPAELASKIYEYCRRIGR